MLYPFDSEKPRGDEPINMYVCMYVCMYVTTHEEQKKLLNVQKLLTKLIWTCMRFTTEHSTQRKSEDFNSCTQTFL